MQRCLELLIQPIARFCVRHRIGLKKIIEAAKIALVRAAQEDLQQKGEKLSLSRLYLMTGVHRQEIAAILSERRAPRLEDPLTKIIGQWQSDKRFMTRARRPKVLSAVGADSEFARLVKTVNSDINPYSLLFELERSGHVERTSDGVKLLSQDYSKIDSLESGTALAARDLDALLECVEWNTLKLSEDPHHHITTEFDQIPARFLPKIKKWIYNEGISLHRRIRKFLSELDTDINPAIERDNEKKLRILFSSFSLSKERPK